MDERNLAQRRKSGLVVSISMENPIVDEFETEWPKLARTEIIAKMARNTSTNNNSLGISSREATNENETADGIRFDSTSISCQKTVCNDDPFPFLSTLRQSCNLCSPVFKEHRGNEKWRDYL